MRYPHILHPDIVTRQKTCLNKGYRVIAFGVIASVCSFIYGMCTGEYNGDFSTVPTNLNNELLFLILILTLIPYIFLAYLYKRTVKKFFTNPYCSSLKGNVLRNITWLMIFLSIMFSIVGYGRMGQGESTLDVNNPFSILQSLLYKLSSLPWVIVYVLSTVSKRDTFITLLLFSLNSLLKFSLGGIFIVGILMLYKFDSIGRFIRKNLLLCGFILIFMPTSIAYLYNLRTELRHGRAMQEVTATDLMFNRFCGRISSFSNNGITIQNLPYVVAIQNQYPETYMIYDALKFFGIHHSQYSGIGHVMQREIVGSQDENYTTMTGFGGMIAFSLAKSPLILLFNIILIILLISLIFYLPLKFKFCTPFGISLICSFGFCTSFDPSELTRIIFGFIIIALFLKLFNGIRAIR